MKITREVINQVWELGHTVQHNNPNEFRKDKCGAWISRHKYGNRKSMYGWEISHKTALSEGGTYNLSNLCPLHWENNNSKLCGISECTTTSSGSRNISKTIFQTC